MVAKVNQDVASLFATELASASPVRLALAIARIAFSEIDVDAYLDELASMAKLVAPRVAGVPLGEPRALALLQAMRLDLELHGNTDRYYDANNSYLNVVLERRTGLPIMLSLVMVAIGRELGLDVDGAGFPGHFLTRYQDSTGVWFLDLFHGVVLSPDEVPLYFAKLFGQSSLRMDEGYFAPMAPEAWAQRILNNLYAVYGGGGEAEMLAKVLQLMLVLQPTNLQLWSELGTLLYHQGDMDGALRALRRYFYLQGHVVLNAPDIGGQSMMGQNIPVLSEADQEMWNLLEEIESARMRWN